jgi:hypothetical protein
MVGYFNIFASGVTFVLQNPNCTIIAACNFADSKNSDCLGRLYIVYCIIIDSCSALLVDCEHFLLRRNGGTADNISRNEIRPLFALTLAPK